MWPILLDMTKDECKRSLRRLELEAYGNIVSALRAQGGLSTEKHKLLQDIASTLNIPQERHRAEIRRAVNDERLATIAHCMTGDDSSDEWALEGRRLIPLMPRLAPQTAYSVIADDEANKVSLENEKLPLPANTERKRPLQTSTTETLNKNVPHRDVHFRVPSEAPSKAPVQVKTNMEEIVSKKRKSSMTMESSSLAQHLMMGQPKLSRVQQLYRQKTKAILKSQIKQHRVTPPISQLQKVNVIKQEDESSNTIPEVPIPKQVENKIINQVTIPNPPVTTENQTPRSKPTIISTTIIKPGSTSTNTNNNNTNSNTIVSQPQTPVVSSTSEVAQQKSIKICPARKVITTTARTPSTPQKVIIVSTPQGTTTSSILQRTLSSIPFMKTISMKNLDKVKVINNPNAATTNVTSATNQKPKLLTVQTKTKSGTLGKQVSIPFIQGVQLQALQNKGAIKMLPLTTNSKGTSKPAIISTTAGSLYIMNSNTTLPIVTSSNTTPVVSTKTETKNNNEPEIKTELNASSNIIILKNELIKPATPKVKIEPSDNIVLSDEAKDAKKSSVLAEILKASGVIPNDYNDPNDNDIESQISQLTEIPNVNSTQVITSSNITENTVAEVTNATTETLVKTEEIDDTIITNHIKNEIISDDNLETVIKEEHIEINIKNEEMDTDISSSNVETVIQEDNENIVNFEETVMEDISPDSNNYVILQDETEEQSETLLLEEHSQSNEEVVELMGSLDPETGMYSMKTPQEYELIHEVDNNQSQIPSDSYVIEMEMESLHSELDMPSLSN